MYDSMWFNEPERNTHHLWMEYVLGMKGNGFIMQHTGSSYLNYSVPMNVWSHEEYELSSFFSSCFRPLPNSGGRIFGGLRLNFKETTK